MSEALKEYQSLLSEYHRCVRRPGWWDGPRQALVERMDALWPALTGRNGREGEKAAALAYAEKLYRGQGAL